MIVLYACYVLYAAFAVAYIHADYGEDAITKMLTKIPAGLLYLSLAVLAFWLNRVDGQPVAVQHFSWVFAAMLCCFLGDMAMLAAGGKKVAMLIGMAGFFLAHVVLTVYFTRYLASTGARPVNLAEGIIVLAGLVLAALFLRNKRLDFGKPAFKAAVYVFFMSSVVMIAKAASLVKVMNTGASWPALTGVLLVAVSDFFLAYKYFSREKTTYALGAALALYFAGMAALPLSIFYM